MSEPGEATPELPRELANLWGLSEPADPRSEARA